MRWDVFRCVEPRGFCKVGDTFVNWFRVHLQLVKSGGASKYAMFDNVCVERSLNCKVLHTRLASNSFAPNVYPVMIAIIRTLPIVSTSVHFGSWLRMYSIVDARASSFLFEVVD